MVAGLRERATEHLDLLREATREVDRQAGRVALRLASEHDTTIAYGEAFLGLTTVIDAIWLAADLGDAADLKETNAKIRSGSKQAAEAHDRFLVAAKELVASRLEIGNRWRFGTWRQRRLVTR